MNNISTHVPPGFRFYPTDEELVDYYLRRKVNSRRIDLDVIKEVDLYKIEPWDLKEICRMGNEEEQSDWYFFSHKDKKYPTGTRTNRATAAGFWKATGRDKAIYSKHDLIGMRKTLVFYKGRAPNGQKSDWIMHEYRLETDENGPPQEEGWVVCRVFKKKATSTMRMNASEQESQCWYDDHLSFPPNFDSPKQEGTSQLSNNLHNYSPYTRKIDLLDHQHQQRHHLPFRIPQEQHLIHFPTFPEINSKMVLPSPHHHGTTSNSNNALMTLFGLEINQEINATSTILSQFHDNNPQNVDVDNQLIGSNIIDNAHLDDHVSTDWRVLDKFVASQLSQEVVISASNKEKNTPLPDNSSKKEESMPDNASTSTTTSSQIEVPK